jgi:hypothetical protein
MRCRLTSNWPNSRGCSLKKILVHSPKKSEKSKKNPKNPKKIQKIHKNPPKIKKNPTIFGGIY